MTDQEPAAEWVPVAHLKGWKDNPRENDHVVPALMESIERFGFAAPIVARKEDGMIVAGHTRLKAALELRMTEVPVRWMDLTEAEARMLALADNKLAELAAWDEEMLAKVIEELLDEGHDVEGLGFSEDEIHDIMGFDVEAVDDIDEHDTDDLDLMPENVPALTKPGDVIELGRHTLTCGDCIEVMRGLPDNSVDAVVTDPPYGIGFMGKGWDCAVPGEDFAREALRVLKPGGHLIAFAATRTVHRLAVALEDAGFEIRDQIAWLQWQGFPKSLDVSKAIDQHHGAERAVVGSYEVTRDLSGGSWADLHGQKNNATQHKITAPATADAKKWEGWGTALKPSQEPAILARKPLEGTVAENVLKWSVGGLNVDACRIAYGDPAWPGPNQEVGPRSSGGWQDSYVGGSLVKPFATADPGGRWPGNIYHCAKPSRSEREAGCEELPDPSATVRDVGGAQHTKNVVLAKNHHPTVKPTALMQWLVRLVTPPGAVVLEPFCGSGTTLIAAELEGVTCWAIEREPAYCDIIRARHGGIVGEAE